MNNHEEKLQKLCRLCGKVIVNKPGYLNSKHVDEYATLILRHYCLIVENEEKAQYPKFLCSPCKQKLERLKKSSNKLPKLEAATFSPHVDKECFLCKDVKKYKVNATASVFDMKLKTHGFIRTQQEVYDYKWIYIYPTYLNGTMRCKYSLFIYNNLKWVVKYFDFDITNNSFLANLPLVLDNDNIDNFANYIVSLKPCEGNRGFTDVIKSRLSVNEPFLNEKSELRANVETDSFMQLKKDDFKVIRTTDCHLFVSALNVNRCPLCITYGNTLRKAVHRLKNIPEATAESRAKGSSHANYRYLSEAELKIRLKDTQSQKKQLSQKIATLQSKIEKLVENEGVSLENEQHTVVKEVISQEKNPFDPETPQFLLWSQQKEQSSKSNAKGMRWHPLIIRWCLSIFLTSPAAYKQMSSKKLQFLKLPSVNTLKRNTQFTVPSAGFNPDVIKLLIEKANIKEMEEFQKNVSIIFDEMKIKTDLVYRKSTGQLIGFTELGTINDTLNAFEQKVQNDNNMPKQLASHVLVYMVRGITTNLLFPFAYFASNGFTSAQLYPTTMQAIDVLEQIGLKVRAIVSDGASPNRKFYEIITGDTEESFHYFVHPSRPNRLIYVMSDVPHLLKTTRNCLENSKWHANTKNMHNNGKDITWRHIVDVYYWDLGEDRDAPGLRKLHKLTEEHINLSPRHRMSVKLASQVLSASVGNALECQGKFGTEETANFVKIFDRVFDCLNVSRFSNSSHKPELEPYTSTEDWRFKFLLNDFLENYLGKWEANVMSNDKVSPDEKKKMLLSKQTRHGWKMTIYSFVKLTKTLLLEGVPFVLSEKFTQDPLEEHFSRQRRRGGSNENPNLFQYGNQENLLHIMDSELIADLRGNTSGRRIEAPTIDVHDTRKLPKKSDYK